MDANWLKQLQPRRLEMEANWLKLQTQQVMDANWLKHLLSLTSAR